MMPFLTKDREPPMKRPGPPDDYKPLRHRDAELDAAEIEVEARRQRLRADAEEARQRAMEAENDKDLAQKANAILKADLDMAERDLDFYKARCAKIDAKLKVLGTFAISLVQQITEALKVDERQPDRPAQAGSAGLAAVADAIQPAPEPKPDTPRVLD